VRGDAHDDVPMEPTIDGRQAIAMITTVFRRPSAPDGEGGDTTYSMRSLELASVWARLDSACGAYTLAESEPLVSTASAMLPTRRQTVARAGCVAEVRSNNEHTTRSLDGLTSLVPVFAFATIFSLKLHADINEPVNLLRFANLVSTQLDRVGPESRRFGSRLSQCALAFWASDPPTTCHLGKLRDKFYEQCNAVFLAVCRIYGLPSSRILSALRSLTLLLVLFTIYRFKIFVAVCLSRANSSHKYVMFYSLMLLLMQVVLQMERDERCRIVFRVSFPTFSHGPRAMR
jgi:hypothetical protein